MAFTGIDHLAVGPGPSSFRRSLSQVLVSNMMLRGSAPDAASPDALIRAENTPDACRKVAGVPLVRRSVLALHRAGVNRVVVTTSEPDRVRVALGGVPSSIDLRVIATNDGSGELARWLRATSTDLIVVPGDILAHSEVFLRALDMRDGNGVARITAAGKDTGVRIAMGKAVTTIRRNGLDAWARLGTDRAIEIGDALWKPVRTSADVTEGERALLATLRKTTDGPISRRFNRPISLAISRRLAGTRIGPNTVTAINLLIGVVSGLSVATGTFLGFLIGGVLFHVTSVIDGVDGELAKLTYRESRRGEWFDTVSDNITYLFCMGGLTIGAMKSAVPDWYWQIGVAGGAAVLLALINQYVNLLIRKRSGTLLSVKYGYESGATRWQRLVQALGLMFRRDVFAFGVMMLAVIGQLPLILPILGSGAILGLLPGSIKANIDLVLERRLARQQAVLQS